MEAQAKREESPKEVAPPPSGRSFASSLLLLSLFEPAGELRMLENDSSEQSGHDPIDRIVP